MKLQLTLQGSICKQQDSSRVELDGQFELIIEVSFVAWKYDRESLMKPHKESISYCDKYLKRDKKTGYSSTHFAFKYCVVINRP